eukprot:Pgem_evm1s1236
MINANFTLGLTVYDTNTCIHLPSGVCPQIPSIPIGFQGSCTSKGSPAVKLCLPNCPKATVTELKKIWNNINSDIQVFDKNISLPAINDYFDDDGCLNNLTLAVSDLVRVKETSLCVDLNYIVKYVEPLVNEMKNIDNNKLANYSLHLLLGSELNSIWFDIEALGENLNNTNSLEMGCIDNNAGTSTSENVSIANSVSTFLVIGVS